MFWFALIASGICIIYRIGHFRERENWHFNVWVQCVSNIPRNREQDYKNAVDFLWLKLLLWPFSPESKSESHSKNANPLWNSRGLVRVYWTENQFVIWMWIGIMQFQILLYYFMVKEPKPKTLSCCPTFQNDQAFKTKHVHSADFFFVDFPKAITSNQFIHSFIIKDLPLKRIKCYYSLLDALYSFAHLAGVQCWILTSQCHGMIKWIKE